MSKKEFKVFNGKEVVIVDSFEKARAIALSVASIGSKELNKGFARG